MLTGYHTACLTYTFAHFHHDANTFSLMLSLPEGALDMRLFNKHS